MIRDNNSSLFRKLFSKKWMFAADVMAVLFGVVFLQSLFIIVLQSVNVTPGSTAELCLNELLLLISILASAGIYLKIRGSSLLSLGWGLSDMPVRFIKSWLLVAGLMGAGFLIPLLSGAILVDSVQLVPAPLLASLLLCFLVGLAEEVFFRGFLLSRGKAYGLSGGFLLIVSSLLFALVHIENDSVNFLSLFNIFAAGVFLGIPYLYTRNVWPSVLLHWAWNFMQGNVYGYHVSGYDFGTSILVTVPSGNSLLTGGSFGFEGSLPCTLVLAAGCLLLYKCMKK